MGSHRLQTFESRCIEANEEVVQRHINPTGLFDYSCAL